MIVKQRAGAAPAAPRIAERSQSRAAVLPRFLALTLASATACGGEDSQGSSANALNPASGSPGGGTAGSSCSGVPIADPPDLRLVYAYQEDVRYLTTGLRSIARQSLVSGEVEVLFDLEEGDAINDVAIDANDIFAIRDFELYRYDLAMNQLSMFAEAPESPVETTFLGRTAYAPFVSISDTQVFTAPYDTEGTAEGGAQFRSYLGVYSRQTSELELLPTTERILPQPHGGALVIVRSIDQDPDPSAARYSGEIQTYDMESGQLSSLATSPAAFGQRDYAFWNDSIVYLVSTDDGRSHDLMRVALAGGSAQTLLSGVEDDGFVVAGDKAYVQVRGEPGADRSRRDVLTELDLTSGATRAIETCEGAVMHANSEYVFVDAQELLRIAL